MRRLIGYRLVAVLASLVLVSVVVLNGLGTFYTDIKPEIYIRPTEMLGRYLSSWTSSPYLGSPNFNVGLLPVLVILSALREVGLSPEWAFKVFHVALWWCAAFGAARLARSIAPQLGRWGPLIAAVLYLANPYTITAGATLAIALPMALLPWQLLCLVHALRRPRSWAWPALFGLTFFLMSGMNVGIVPVFGLLSVIPLVLAVRAADRVPWGDIIRVVTRSAAFVILVSLYWLVPAVTATTTGAQIVASSETLEGISKVSSLVEVLRGLGLWPLYGSSAVGPWVPEHAVYLTSPLVMILTMAWPALGILALRWASTRARVFIAVAMFGATTVMIGVFPGPDSPASGFGWLLRELFEIPVFSAFRTTNKIGGLLALALAISVAIGILRLWAKGWSFAPARVSIVVVTGTLFAAWALPALAGTLYISPVDIPEYWHEASASLDDSSQPGSVLVLPGQVRPHYRWTEDRPDDILNSVLTRRAVLPETTPNASAPAVNFLAALDGSFQSGTSSPQVVSAMVRYLGAGQVLLRHDVVWEQAGGARPAQTSEQLAQDPGLFGRENFGFPGENTLSPSMEDPYFFGEQNLPPLQVYDVSDARAPLRAESLRGSLIVAGDGFAFPQMADAGMLAATPLIRYAHDLAGSAFAVALAQADRLVLTDTNARRNVIDNRLTVGHGALLSSDEPLDVSRTLGDDPDDQTVREDEAIRVTTSKSGGTFFDLPFGAGHFAFDGDLSTGWRFGDFGTGKGQSVTAHFAEPRVIGRVGIAQLPIGAQQINEVLIRAGGHSRTVTLPEAGPVDVDFEGVESESLSVTVLSTRGEGYNFVGIAEINVDNLRAEPIGRTPITLSNRWDALDKSGRTRFAKTPLDILFARVQNTASEGDDSERVLDRRFDLPDEREFSLAADIRAAGSVETMYDRIEGRGTKVRASSSGFYFNNPESRASRAADDDADTGWVPGNGTRGAWWQLDGPMREITSVTLTQRRMRGAEEHHHATEIGIEVDGTTVASAKIGLGEHRIVLPKPVRGERVRIRITGIAGDPSSAPGEFTSIDTGLLMRSATAKAQCLPMLTIDDEPIAMRPSTVYLAGRADQGSRWEACEPVKLDAGEHRLRHDEGVTIDSAHLADRQQTMRPNSPAPTTKVLRDGDSRKQIHVAGASGPYAVVIGQGSHSQWRAWANGVDLGPAQTVNGFSGGWIVPDGRAAVIDIRFVPQLWSTIALIVSGVTLMGIAMVVIGAAMRRTLLAIPEADVSPLPAFWTPRRLVLELTFLAGGLFFGGIAGFIGAGTWIAIQRWRQPTGATWIAAGASLVMSSILAQFVVLMVEGEVGTVSADAVSASMVPHSIALVGLYWAVAGALAKAREFRG